jgi:hypothetical protein
VLSPLTATGFENFTLLPEPQPPSDWRIARKALSGGLSAQLQQNETSVGQRTKHL